MVKALMLNLMALGVSPFFVFGLLFFNKEKEQKKL